MWYDRFSPRRPAAILFICTVVQFPATLISAVVNPEIFRSLTIFCGEVSICPKEYQMFLMKANLLNS